MVQVPHYALADIRSVNMIVVRILAVIPVLDRFRKPSPCLEVLDDGSATFLNHDQSIPDYVQRVALRQFVTKKHVKIPIGYHFVDQYVHQLWVMAAVDPRKVRRVPLEEVGKKKCGAPPASRRRTAIAS